MQSTFQNTQAVASSDMFLVSHEERFLPIKWWAQELKKLAKDEDIPEGHWALIGRAALVLNDNDAYSKKIKDLIAKESEYEIKELHPDKVLETFSQGFLEISQPTLFVFPMGVWSVSCEDHPNAVAIQMFQKSFSLILESIPKEKKIAFMAYGDDIHQMVSELKQAGGFDRKYFVESPSLYERGETFTQSIPEEIRGETLRINPEIIGQLVECEADNEKKAQLIVLGLKRLAYKEDRKVEFTDLVRLALNGISEFLPSGATNIPMHHIALHEAGHALISIVDSKGLNIPDYASIVQSVSNMGQVSASYEYLANVHTAGNYQFKRHLIRVLLGGRAAEQIALGIEGMSVMSSRGDLRHASKVALDLVGRFGVSPHFEDEETAGSNLYITNDDEEISPSERTKIETYASQLLGHQYKKVLEMISANKKFLSVLADSIATHKILKKDDMRQLAMECGVLQTFEL